MPVKAKKRPRPKRLPLLTVEMDNDLRADYANEALIALAHLTHQDTSGDLEHDKETVVGDLLSYLMHLCDREGMDFKKILQRGVMHYEAEQEE